MDTFPNIDLAWRGSQSDIQLVQEMVASFDIPTKIGTKQLGLQSDVWVTPTEVIGIDGIIDDPEIVYLPLGGRGELDDKLAYPLTEDEKFVQVLDTVYENILKLNTLDAVMPVIGWFFPHFRYSRIPIISMLQQAINLER